MRRRRATRIAIGAAAAVLAVALTGALLSRASDSDPTPVDRGNHSLPTEWRTAYWRDLKIEVPADWGYGGAPVGSGGLVSCYPEAMVGPGGAPLEGQPTRGCVGRPIVLTDVCAPYPDNRPGGPQAPYVWLDAEIPTGIVDLGDGFVQETVEVNRSGLTVGAADAVLRRRILDPVVADDLCAPELANPPRARSILVEGMRAIDSMSVCAYQRTGGERLELTYATAVDADRATEFVWAALAVGDRRRCARAPTNMPFTRCSEETATVSVRSRSATWSTSHVRLSNWREHGLS